MKHLHPFKQTFKAESDHKRFGGNLFSAFLKCGIIVMLCAMNYSISAQTQSEINDVRNAINNATLLDGSVQIGGTGAGKEWYVVRKETINGVQYALLLSKHCLSTNVPFNASTNSNNYEGSSLQTRITNTEYGYLPAILKAIAVTTTSLGTYNNKEALSVPSSTMASSVSNKKDVLFPPSYAEALLWNKGKTTPLRSEMSQYQKVRWWTRTAGDGNCAWEVCIPANTFASSAHVMGTDVALVGAIWVKYSLDLFSVSGTVSGLQNNENVQVCYKINNGSQLCVTTTAGGAYKISDIPSGSNVEIIPSPQPNYNATLLFTPNPMNVMANLTGKDIQYNKQTYNVHGTVFPFVYTANETFDTLFTVTAELYAIPQGIDNAILALLKATPVQKKKAVFYDGTIFVETTPLHPGEIGATNNPGLPIDWEPMGYTPDMVDCAPVTKLNNNPDKPVGLYTFNNVVEGDYILILSAPGFVTRYAKIHIGSNDPLGHRELIAGDFNDDGFVDQRDATLINEMQASYPSAQYNSKYDLNGDKHVDATDINLVTKLNFGFSFRYYKETWSWLFQ